MNAKQFTVKKTLFSFFRLTFLFFGLLFAMTSVATTLHQTKSEGKYPKYPSITISNDALGAQIKRGEYLAHAGDCIACHTKPGGQSFAGGLGMKTPFGTIYSPNITPDKETGIGKWTQKQFIHAMRDGVSPDDSNYFPLFPYVFFNKMTTQDLLDIKAYLDAIPAVRQVNRPVDMPWPYRVRFFQNFWKLIYFDFYKGQFKPDPNKSKEWNRGAYLVQGPGHCAACHTRMNFMGMWERKYNLAGAFVEGFYAPDITSRGLGKTPTSEIVRVFLGDKLIGGGMVQGPMLEVNHNSLEDLTQSDLRDIVTYLKTVKSEQPPQPKMPTGTGVGKTIYNKYCSACHSIGAGGAPKVGDAKSWAPFIQQGINTLYKKAITGYKGMPAKGMCPSCTNEQLKEAVNYMVSKSRGAAGTTSKDATSPAE